MVSRIDELAQTMGDVARVMDEAVTVQETLSAIITAARDTIPGGDHVSISVIHHDRRIETVTATGDAARRIDEVQYELGEGPCLDALEHKRPLEVEDLRDESRWPRFAKAAAAMGIHSRMAFLLYTSDENLGALNIYSESCEAFDSEAQQIGQLFATHAALAYGQARTQGQLTDAMATRQRIGQAIGIVMERHGIDEDRAFQFLVRVSTTGNIKLRDVAAELVTHGNTRARDKK